MAALRNDPHLARLLGVVPGVGALSRTRGARTGDGCVARCGRLSMQRRVIRRDEDRAKETSEPFVATPRPTGSA
jgi:hypothetical protein